MVSLREREMKLLRAAELTTPPPARRKDNAAKRNRKRWSQ